MRYALMSFLMVQSLYSVAEVVLASEQAPISLTDSVTSAKSFHPALKQAESRMHISKAEENEAKAGFYPQIRGSYSTGEEYADTQSTRSFLNGSNKEYVEKWSVSLRQHIFNGLETEKRVSAAGYNAESSEYAYEDTANRIAMQAIQLHLNVLKSKALWLEAIENTRHHQDYASHIRRKVEQKIIGSEKLAQAESRLALAQTAEINSRSQLAQSRLSYFEFTGVKPNHLLEAVLPDDDIGEFPVVFEQSLQKNLQIKQAQAAVFAAKSTQKAAQGSFYPKVEFVASGNKSDSSADNTFTQDDDPLVNTFVGFEVNYQFFSGGADWARSKRMQYRYEEAQYKLETVERDTREELSKSLTEFNSLKQQQPQLATYADNSKTVLDSYTEQILVNRISLYDLLNQQNEYFSAKTKLIENRYALIRSYYYIKFLTGQLVVE